MAPIQENEHVWKRLGLKMKDYVVQVNVTTKGYSELMREIIGGGGGGGRGGDTSLVGIGVAAAGGGGGGIAPPPVLVLIDTEGFDCDIVRCIPPTSPYLPQFMIFEKKQCYEKLPGTYAHMKQMGYSWKQTSENAFLVRNQTLVTRNHSEK
jgi:hypothetical protein